MIDTKSGDGYPRQPFAPQYPQPTNNTDYVLLGRPSGSGITCDEEWLLYATETATHTNIIYVSGIFVQYCEIILWDSSAEALQ